MLFLRLRKVIHDSSTVHYEHISTPHCTDTHKTAEYGSAQAKQIHIRHFGREELEIALKGSTSQYFKYFFATSKTAVDIKETVINFVA